MAYSDPVKKAESARRWRVNNPDRVREYNSRWKKQWREQNRDKARERAKLDYAHYRESNPLKDKARYEVRKALRNGTLMRKPCEVCGTMKNLEAHHTDYNKPLDVHWLCQEHHIELHDGKALNEPISMDV